MAGRRVRVPPWAGFTDAWYLGQGWYVTYSHESEELVLMNFKTIKKAIGKSWNTNTSG